MIEVNVISSSSKGNCYSISNGQSTLMIECGLPWKKIQKAMDFKTSDIDGILISHYHGDHCKGAKAAAAAGIDIYTSMETAGMVGLTGHRVNKIDAGIPFSIGGWRILPFPAVHKNPDGTKCDGALGFLISDGEDKLLFLTDSAYCPYVFPGLTHLLIEANFSQTILDRNVAAGYIHYAMRVRVMESHFSIERVEELIKENDISRLRWVYLMHLSAGNSDEADFKKRIQALTGIPVHVCEERIG